MNVGDLKNELEKYPDCAHAVALEGEGSSGIGILWLEDGIHTQHVFIAMPYLEGPTPVRQPDIPTAEDLRDPGFGMTIGRKMKVNRIGELLAEYQKGCSNDGHLNGSLADPTLCPECSRAFIDALTRALPVNESA